MNRKEIAIKKKQLQQDIDFQQITVDRLKEKLLIEERDLNYMKGIQRNQINIPHMPQSIVKEE